MNLQSALDELLAKHNGDVLPLTVHVLRNPTRLALLCADGNRREYRITDTGAAPVEPVEVFVAHEDGVPPPIRITVPGFQDAMFYGKPAGEA